MTLETFSCPFAVVCWKSSNNVTAKFNVN
jgi:hypothetical protein